MPEPKRILIVDDSSMIQQVLKSVFSANDDYKCACAGNGKEAIETLRKNKGADVILLDLLMPVMDGYEFLKQTKTDVFFSRIPVIIISTQDTPEDKKQAKGLGAWGFVEKTNTDVLADMVVAALAGKPSPL